MRLVAPHKDVVCRDVLNWRESCPESLRTPHPLNYQQQERFFDDVICDMDSNHKYFEIFDVHPDFPTIGPTPICFGGLTNIDWHNRNAEISLIVDPNLQGKGYGQKAVKLLLDYAKNRMQLSTIYGECYMCSKAVKFWQMLADNTVILPRRKWWDGKYWDSLYFTFFLENRDEPVVHEDGD